MDIPMVARKLLWVSQSHHGWWKARTQSGSFSPTLFFLVDHCPTSSYVYRSSHFNHLTTRPQGRWWFGSRAYTKDGVHAKSAETFFKEIKEESKMEDVIKVLAHTWPHEKYSSQKIEGGKELESLEKDISAEITTPWLEKVRLRSSKRHFFLTAQL
jgi:hypothetical protein